MKPNKVNTRTHLLFVSITVILTCLYATGSVSPLIAQTGYTHGQSIAPVFEGWEPLADGSFDMVFGFYNRNCVEELHIPIGPENFIEPNGPDQGQPTRFYPRRGKFVFRINVPMNFGDKELVWTLTSQNGSTEQAYATLNPEYVLDQRITMMNEGGFGQRAGEGESSAPTLTVTGSATREVRVGQPITLTGIATDDGIPKPRTGQEDSDAAGLMVGWSLYRGNDEHVTLEPEQFNPDLRNRSTRNIACQIVPATPKWAKERLADDGSFAVTATFDEPGTYVLRAMAHDGGLKTTKEITVTVTS